MFAIELQELAKRFREDWVFRGITMRFESPGRYAVLGPNGSGKSTFLKILSGQLSPSSGSIRFLRDQRPIQADQVYQSVSYAGPYIELIEEFSIDEALSFQRSFKPFHTGIDNNKALEILGFCSIRQRQIRHLSSGQKQRVKLALAILSSSELLLLDEPSTNLDVQGMDWFQDLLAQYAGDRLLVIASNEVRDLVFCDQQIGIGDFKKKK